jgi:hypothetical protein
MSKVATGDDELHHPRTRQFGSHLVGDVAQLVSPARSLGLRGVADALMALPASCNCTPLYGFIWMMF